MSIRAWFVILCVAAGCGARQNPGLRLRGERPSIPATVDWAETSVAGAHGTPIYLERWRPAAGEPKAVVVIHHGLADHSSRYGDFALRLVAAGYTVWALDMRGHGRSAGPRVSIDRVDDFLDDLDAVFARVRAEEPGRTLFLYGHSVGGMVSCLYTIERRPVLGGLVLSSAALAFDAPPLQAAAVRTIAALAPDAPILDTPHRAFSSRPDVVADMDSDPLIAQGRGAARTVRSVVDGVARIWAAPRRLSVPVLAIHGADDTLTAPSGSRDIAARAGTTDATVRIYPGRLHDLLREPDGDRVAQDVVAWLDAHAGGATTAPASALAAGPLRGDRPSRALSVELEARGERPGGGALGDDPSVTGGLRLRFGAGRAALGAGYLGGFDLRAGYLNGGVYEADAHLLGLAMRAASGSFVAVTGGVGIGGPRGGTATHLPVELSGELAAGPIRLLAHAGAGWRLGGDRYAGDAHGIADELTALVGLRLGADRRYWSSVTSGAGPYLAVTYRNLGGAELWGVALGVDLWGGS